MDNCSSFRAKIIYHATWKRKELRHANSENANLNAPRPVRMPVPLVHAVGVQFNDEPRQNSAPKDTKEKLFDLVYSCRKETAKGEVMVMTWEECGMVSPPCLDAGTNPETSEVTYQVSVFFVPVHITGAREYQTGTGAHGAPFTRVKISHQVFPAVE